MIRDQRIRDPIHNLIKFSQGSSDDELLWKLIQTPPLQRLRRIKQLGFSEFVYPGASHTRLSHVIGAMQMARRMMAALERNKVVDVQKAEHGEWKTATLCAALLHDVGHGPFSHVFEEVSKNLGVKIAHEMFTRRIISEGEIARELGGLLDKVQSFFEKDEGFNVYASIISSQLDADRLDFLVRDRYFTGIQSAAIDLEWLFDSLKIEYQFTDIAREAREHIFVVDIKGLSVVEEYLSAYSKMYTNVYFHKTTRAVQYMVMDILNELFTIHKNALPADMPLKRYFDEAPEPSIESYLKLDDSSIVELIKLAADHNFGAASHVARRYLNRDLYKCYIPSLGPTIPIGPHRLRRFIEALKQSQLKYHQDIPQAKVYKQYDIIGPEFMKNILIKDGGGEPLPIGKFVPRLDVQSDRQVRFYFKSEADKQSAAEIWREVRD